MRPCGDPFYREVKNRAIIAPKRAPTGLKTAHNANKTNSDLRMSAFGGKADIKLLGITLQTLHVGFLGRGLRGILIPGWGVFFPVHVPPRLAFLTSMLSLEQEDEYGSAKGGILAHRSDRRERK